MPVPVRVSPALGVERRPPALDPRAQALDHGHDDVVVADAQPVGQDLHRQVPVAQVPGDPDHGFGALARDVGDRLGRGVNRHGPPVVEEQAVAVVQGPGLGQLEQEGEPTVAGEREAPPVPVVEVQRDLIGRARRVEGPGRQDAARRRRCRWSKSSVTLSAARAGSKDPAGRTLWARSMAPPPQYRK
jgi:hypothetical protein